MPGRRTYLDNNLFAEEQTTVLRANAGITARLLGTCCLGGTASSTKSPTGAKPRAKGDWEDCPAFDLEPIASRQVSAMMSITTKGQGQKDDDQDRSSYSLQLRQVPVGEAEQMLPGTSPTSNKAAVKALSGPQVSVNTSVASDAGPPEAALTPVEAMEPPAADGGACAPPPITLRPTASSQDSATDMMLTTAIDYDGLPPSESFGFQCPTPQPQFRERQTNQQRLARRLLERGGVMSEDGRTSASGAGTNPGLSVCNGTADERAVVPPSQLQPPLRPKSPQMLQMLPPGSSCDGGGGGGGPRPLSPGSGLGVSPSSESRTTSNYYSALSSPATVPRPVSPGVRGGGGGGDMETLVDVDERLCMQEEMYDPMMHYGEAYRVSAPGLGVRDILQANRGAWPSPEAARGDGGGGKRPPTGDSAVGDSLLHIRGSDFGGVTGNTVPEPVCVRVRGLRVAAATANGDLQNVRTSLVAAAAGGGTPRSAVVPLVSGPDDADGGVVMAGGGRGGVVGSLRRGAPPAAWSAAGGRDELSLAEKEWLFGQSGGIGGLAQVMALGEGGEGVVDLVRLDLPGRTLHLARKATRTCVPAFALAASGGTGAAATAAAVLGVRSHSVRYRFPFEFFDREVKAMKAVKESGFVIRFQAAAYDHEAGQGFILMEAAPYGTLEDLHAALCRSQLQPVQRQRPALLQRAFAKFNFANAKSSAPPILMGGSSGPSGTAAILPRLGPPALLLNSPPNGGGIRACGDGTNLEELTDRGRPSCLSPVGLNQGPAVGSDEGPESAMATATAAAPGGDGNGGAAGGGGGGGNNSDPLQSTAQLGSSLMSTRALRYYGACMLQALIALHEAGYVYRDLKLSNVLVCDGGRVRLTDFGAATPSLPNQPGLFGGAAGTRAYLAPEVLPWLERNNAKSNKRLSGTGGGAAGPEPYTVTVDSWNWGLVMAELATGWSLRELNQRIIRRVCAPRGAEPPDLPPDCGLPPLLRQLLLDHVLIREHAERWTAARIRSHPFFDGLDWSTLAEAEGPHAHLFVRARHANTPPSPLPLSPSPPPAPPVPEGPNAVVTAAATTEGELVVTARRVSRPSGLASPARSPLPPGLLTLPGDGGDGGGVGDAATEVEGGEGSVVVPFGHRGSGGLISPKPSFTGNAEIGGGGGGGGYGPPSPYSPMGLISPSGVLVSPSGGSRISGAGFMSSASGCGRGGAASVRQMSSPGNGPLIGPVVLLSPPSGSSPSFLVPPRAGSGLLAAAGIAVPGGIGCVSGGRRATLQGGIATATTPGTASRLSSGSYARGNTPPARPQTPLQYKMVTAAE